MRLQQITCGHFKADDGTLQDIHNNRIDELVDAIDNHIFDQVDENRNFHGNYEINYAIPS